MKRWIDKCDKNSGEYLRQYLANAPEWLLDSFQIVNVEKDTIFIAEGEKAQKVFILLKGSVTAIDYRVRETAYSYAEFYPTEVFGALEIIGGMDTYMTTLVTAENCVFLKVGSERFEKWLRSDMKAFQMQAKHLSGHLVGEARRERLNVLLKAKDRIALILIKEYEHATGADKLQIYLSRKVIMEATGLSERTVTRSLKEFEAEGKITRSGWDIVLTKEQYLNLKKLVENKINKMGV